MNMIDDSFQVIPHSMKSILNDQYNLDSQKRMSTTGYQSPRIKESDSRRSTLLTGALRVRNVQASKTPSLKTPGRVWKKTQENLYSIKTPQRISKKKECESLSKIDENLNWHNKINPSSPSIKNKLRKIDELENLKQNENKSQKLEEHQFTQDIFGLSFENLIQFTQDIPLKTVTESNQKTEKIYDNSSKKFKTNLKLTEIDEIISKKAEIMQNIKRLLQEFELLESREKLLFKQLKD